MKRFNVYYTEYTKFGVKRRTATLSATNENAAQKKFEKSHTMIFDGEKLGEFGCSIDSVELN